MIDPRNTPYVELTELEYDSEVRLFPLVSPDKVALDIIVDIYDDDFNVIKRHPSTVALTVFDAMKLREGLDAFISQAVGADV